MNTLILVLIFELVFTFCFLLKCSPFGRNLCGKCVEDQSKWQLQVISLKVIWKPNEVDYLNQQTGIHPCGSMNWVQSRCSGIYLSSVLFRGLICSSITQVIDMTSFQQESKIGPTQPIISYKLSNQACTIFYYA